MIINDALPHLDLDTCKTKSAENLSELFLAVLKHFCVFGEKKSACGSASKVERGMGRGGVINDFI